MSQRSQMHNEDTRPKWLLDLENRKQKPRLAHEVGSGAPCLKCDVVCPGLDLHFWRKICKNCKCGRDDHNVTDDDFPQFDLLLGPSGKSKRTCVVLRINRQKIDNEEMFEWAPPDTTTELAADYMRALPEGKLPIKGSVGATLRKQQLQKQLPLHDIDHEMCDELSDTEKKQFEKYLENLKKYVGQGRVSKIVTVRPFDRSFMTPTNASECLTPKRNPSSITSQPVINLRTPSSFVPKSDYSSSRSLPQPHEQLLNPNKSNALIIDPIAAPSKLDKVYTPHVGQSVNNAVHIPRYHHVLDIIRNKCGNVIQSTNILGGMHYHTTSSSSLKKSFNDEIRPNDISDAIGDITHVGENETVDESVEHGRRVMEMCRLEVPDESVNTVFTSTIGEKNDLAVNNVQLHSHDGNSIHSETLPLSSKPQISEDVVGKQSIIEDNLRNISLLSEPLKHRVVKLPCGVLNDHSNYSKKPILTVDKMLAKALFPHSAIHNANVIGSTLDNEELSGIREKLMAKYRANEEVSEYPIFHRCNDIPFSQNLRFSNFQDDHHDPSNSSTNSEANPIFMPVHRNCYKNPDNTVIRSEELQNPVFPDETVGTSKICNNNMESSIENLLMNQWKETKAQKCHECGDGIRAGDVVVTAEKATNATWHPGCFICCACNELLVDLVYFYYKGKLYCARDLADLMEIPRCFACDELIFVREYTVAEGHNYHVKHFCCWDCDIPLAGKQYISENDRPLCLHCYQKTYAKLCFACNNLIAADQQGVAVKNLNFHATDKCFCCYNCNKTLLNGRMAVKENKLFCTKECIAVYLNANITPC